MRLAFGDESFVEHGDRGIYVIGLVHVSPGRLDEARDTAMSLLEKGQRRIHFHDVRMSDRQGLVERVQRGPWSTTAWVTLALPRQQERARRILLREASYGRGDETWLLESRGRTQDRKDQRLFATVFARGTRNPVILRHAPPSVEPLLWIADVVASASASRLVHELEAPFPVRHCGL